MVPVVAVLQSLVALFTFIPVVTSVNTLVVGITGARTVREGLRFPEYAIVKSFPEDNLEIRDLTASKWISTKVPLRSSIDMVPAMRIARERLTRFLEGENVERIIVGLQSSLLHHIHTECKEMCQPTLTTSMFVPHDVTLPLPSRSLVFFTEMPRTEVAILAFQGPITDFDYDLRPRLSEILNKARLRGIDLEITGSNVLVAEYMRLKDNDAVANELWIVPSRMDVPLSRTTGSLVPTGSAVFPVTQRLVDRMMVEKQPLPLVSDATIPMPFTTNAVQTGIEYPMFGRMDTLADPYGQPVTLRNVEGPNATIHHLRAGLVAEPHRHARYFESDIPSFESMYIPSAYKVSEAGIVLPIHPNDPMFQSTRTEMIPVETGDVLVSNEMALPAQRGEMGLLSRLPGRAATMGRTVV